MLVKPARDLKFRDPATKQFVPATGLEVPETDPLWNRLIAQGDAERIDQPAAPAQARNAPAAPAAPAGDKGGEA